MNALQSALYVQARLVTEIPGADAEVSAFHTGRTCCTVADTAGYGVRLVYRCPCGERSHIAYIISETSADNAAGDIGEYVVQMMKLSLKRHVIEEGNQPNFEV